jgi:hypothetical protein
MSISLWTQVLVLIISPDAQLQVYGEAGDPYGEVISFLRHGDEIVCTG